MGLFCSLNRLTINFFVSSRPSDGSTRSTTRTSTTSTATTASGVAANTPTTPSNTTSVSTPQAPKKTTGTAKSDESGNSGKSGSGSSTNNKVLLSELQNYLSGLKTSDSAGGSQNGRNIDLSTAINAEAVNSVVTDTDKVETLVAHLPTIESDDTAKQQLKDTILSPQFQQALSMFSSALQSGQLGPVVSQFQLSSEAVAAANTGDLEQFVKALEKSATTRRPSTDDTKAGDDKDVPMDQDPTPK